MRSEQDRERLALEAFRRIGIALAAETDVDGIVRSVLMETRQVVEAQVSLFSRSAEPIEEPAGSAAVLLPVLQGTAAETRAIKHDDLALSDGASGLRSYLQVPVVNAAGSQLGVFCFGHRDAGKFSDRSLDFINSLVPWIAAALQRAGVEAKASSAGNGEWIARVSHDLRNPLQRICMVGEILSDSLEGPQRELVNKLTRASESMEKLITDLVDVVALENNTMHLDALAMNLSHSVLASCEALQERAKAAGVELVCNEGTNLPAMTMDTGRIEQALKSLIGQSIEAAPAGTQVVVNCRQTQEAICVEIHDQRPIAESELSSVTGRLYAGARTSAQKADLGLNIARGIIEAHGGQVRAALDSGGGIVWTLAWPVPQAQAAAQ